MPEKKYLVDAAVSIEVKNVPVALDSKMIGSLEEELSDAVTKILESRLTLLDIKGSRSGNDGFIAQISVEQITNWNEL